MDKVIQEIAAERARQMGAEGWDIKHDDEHDRGELAYAAACYAFVAGDQGRGEPSEWRAPLVYWPWDQSWWKPKDARRNLIRAAALIVAEIERLDRAAR